MQNNQETTKIFNEKSKGDKNGDNYILKEDFTNNESFISSNLNLCKKELFTLSLELRAKSEKLFKMETLLTETSTVYSHSLKTINDDSRQREEVLKKTLEEIEVIRSEKHQLTVELDKALSRIDSLNNESLTISNRRNQLDEELKCKNEILVNLENTNQALKMEMERVINQSERQLTSINELESLKSKQEQKITQLNEKVQDSIIELSGLKSSKANLENKILEFEAEKNQADAKIHDMEALNQELKHKISGLEKNTQELNGKISELESSKLELEGSKSAYEKKISELQALFNTDKSELNIKIEEYQAEIKRITEVNQNLINETKSKDDQITNLKGKIQNNLDNFRLEVTNYQSQTESLNTQLNEITSKYDAAQNLNHKLNNEIIVRENDSSKKQSQIDKLTDQLHNYEQNIINLTNDLTCAKQNLEAKIKECHEINSAFAKKSKMLHEFELNLDQKDKELNSLSASQSRLRDKIEQFRSKLNISLEKERGLSTQIEELKKNLSQMTMDFEKERQNNGDFKSSNTKLAMELSKANKTIKEQEKKLAEWEEFHGKFDNHYKQKKKQFDDQIQTLRKDNDELKIKIMHLETRNFQLIDQLNSLKVDIMNSDYENKQKECWIDDLKKTINLMPVTRSANVNYLDNMPSSRQQKFSSTPRSVFLDDSFVKYTSIGLRTGDQLKSLNHIEQDFTLRNFDTGLASANNATMMFRNHKRSKTMPGNELIEPDINQNFVGDNLTAVSKRVCTLSTRNQQSKPHLKCSYALETLPVDLARKNDTKM